MQYDTFGSAGNGAGDFGSAGSYGSPGSSGFRYQSQVDPEELFRTIFGDAFGKGRDFESMFDESNSFNQNANEISQVNEFDLSLNQTMRL